jgi:hypothetical protein
MDPEYKVEERLAPHGMRPEFPSFYWNADLNDILPYLPDGENIRREIAHAVIVPYGNDRYGRTLGVVYVDGKNVNLEMVKAGLSEVYRGKPAKGFDNGPYQKAEDEARCAGIGMWSLGDKYISPKDWRKTH